MLAYREALAQVERRFPARTTETVGLADTLGRVLDSDVIAKSDIPYFTNSAVDGWALSEEDLDCAKGLEILGTVPAGKEAGFRLTAGSTVRVMTGAPVPAGTSAVVMQEDAVIEDDRLFVGIRVEPGRNVRHQGSEIKAQDKVLDAGTAVTAPVLALLAGLGVDEVAVLSRPTIGILVTGDELATPGTVLERAQVYESNSFGIGACLQSIGLSPAIVRCQDDPGAVREALGTMSVECDVILTCGGASVGLFDFVKPAVSESGFDFVFERVAIKPGKPFSFAVRADKRSVFCLPGNPMSALVTFALFVWPVLSPVGRDREPFAASLSTAHTNDSDRTEFVPARLNFGNGQATVSLWPTVGSHALSGLARANVLAEIPPNASVGAGEQVSTVLLPWSHL